MPHNDATRSLAAVLQAVQLSEAWATTPGQPLKVSINFLDPNAGSFAATMAALNWSIVNGVYTKTTGTEGNGNVLKIPNSATTLVTSAQSVAINSALESWAKFANIEIVAPGTSGAIKLWFGNRDFSEDMETYEGGDPYPRPEPIADAITPYGNGSENWFVSRICGRVAARGVYQVHDIARVLWL